MKAIFPGSFDPITLGHIDVIQRLSIIYDEVIVLIAHSSQKNSLFSVDERLSMAKSCLKKLKNVQVDTYTGLTVDYAKNNRPCVLVRSLRGTSDFDYELGIAEANRKLEPKIDTCFLFARSEFTGIASSLVKEIAKNKGSLDRFVTKDVAKNLYTKLKS